MRQKPFKRIIKLLRLTYILAWSLVTVQGSNRIDHGLRFGVGRGHPGPRIELICSFE